MKRAVNRALKNVERRAADPLVRRLAQQLRAQGPGAIVRETGKEILRVGSKYAKPTPKVGLLAILDLLMNADPAYGPDAPMEVYLGAQGKSDPDDDKPHRKIKSQSPLLGTFYYD